MKYNKLGTTNLKVSEIGLGTMTFGEQCTKKVSLNIMDAAYEKGVNFFDTAELYPIYPKKETQGKSEEYIGDWVKNKNIRDKVVIATKITSNHPKIIGATKLSWIREGGSKLKFDKKNLNEAVNESLKRLKTDYIDLYQLHSPERDVAIFGELDFNYNPGEKTWTPFEEILENLKDLINVGKIKYIGVSNETPWGILNYINISKTKKLPRITSVQNGYSLVNRVFDIANSEVSIREKCGLLAYSPLAGGRLSGKYINGKNISNSRYALWPNRFKRNNTERGEKAINKYVDLAKKFNVKPSVMANAFVISRPFLTSCIVGATSIEQLEENLSSVDYKIDKELLNEIDKIHQSDPNPCC